MALIFSMVDGKNPVSNAFEAQKTDRNPERVSDLDPLLDAYFAARKIILQRTIVGMPEYMG